MSTKTKTETEFIDRAGQLAANAGLLLMTMAATAGLVDLPQSPDKRAILPQQPVYAFAGIHNGSQNNTLRRERDDIGPHYVSYSAYQRTPGRSGKH